MADIIFSVVKVITFFINASGIWLILWVFLNNQKKLTNRLFSITTIILILWVDLAVIANFINDLDFSLALVRADFAMSSLFFISIFFFILYFPDDVVAESIKKRKIFISFFSFLVILLSFINIYLTIFTPVVVNRISYESWGLNIILGKGSGIFYLNNVFLILFTFFFLIKKYASLSRNDKLKVSYFVLGIILFISINIIFNIILPQLTNFQLALFGHYSVIFFLGFTAYAIVKQNLFGIKIVLTALLVSFISILLAVDIFLFTESVGLQFLKVIGLLAFLYMGRQLIKSVLGEQERAEKMEILTQELEQANAYLTEIVEMKNDFLHIVSHQLRTPLTAIRGFISMWEDGDFDSYSPRKMSDIRRRIVGNVDRLNNLVNDMVVAMESEGDMNMDFRPVDVEVLVKGNIDMMKPTYEKKGLYIRYKKENKRLPEIEADGKYLSQVFMNLTDNAEKYTQKGGLKIKIERDHSTSLGASKDNLKILFIDTGIGVVAEDKARLFKKFSRGLDSSRINPNGSGLGLFIIKQIIEKHHGKIKLESEGAGKGTTFIITLPIVQPR